MNHNDTPPLDRFTNTTERERPEAPEPEPNREADQEHDFLWGFALGASLRWELARDAWNEHAADMTPDRKHLIEQGGRDGGFEMGDKWRKLAGFPAKLEIDNPKND